MDLTGPVVPQPDQRRAQDQTANALPRLFDFVGARRAKRLQSTLLVRRPAPR
ncbi:MAG: hypothetical protein JWM77_2169 [Rhodospirillales bacterium]|nr:hypothetical protein [Rhodospirillales bacterium]